MKTLFVFSAIFVLFLAASIDHTAEIARINRELKGITDTLNLCQSARSFHLKRIDTLKDLINGDVSEIYRDSVDMNNYFSDHKMALACIAGGFVSFKVKTDFKTNYPKAVDNLASWFIAAAIAYYLFNKDEVDEVISKSEAANLKKKEFYDEIETYKNRISDERNYLSDIVDIETVDQDKASGLRQRLQGLK